MKGIRPSIIIKTYYPNLEALKEIIAGIEEEEMLYTIKDNTASASSHSLAREAANMSHLQVGIGLNYQEATLCVHKIIDILLFDTKTDYRLIGQNASRYIKGNPFIMEGE